MPKNIQITHQSFEERFPNEDACLSFLFSSKYGDAVKCPRCNERDCFYRVWMRRVYECSHCAYQISPCANTIFHKSSTDLKSWFTVMYWMSETKSGISACEVQRRICVTYQTAWRMCHQIRSLMREDDSPLLKGIVEIDETYVGGKRRGRRGRGAMGKSPVVGIVERNGRARAWVTDNVKAYTVMPLITNNVKRGSTVMSDEYNIYNGVSKAGYRHEVVQHGIKEYVRGNIHTNTIEGFWSQIKRSLSGTHHSVSRKYLQAYVNEYVFRYNKRGLKTNTLESLLSRVIAVN